MEQYLDFTVGDEELNFPEEWRGKAKIFIMKVAKFHEQEAVLNLQSFVFKTKSSSQSKPNPGSFV